MSLIKVFFPDFKAIVDLSQLHPVTYFDFELRDGKPIVAFYKPVGSFVYCVEIEKEHFPPGNTMESLISDFEAIELAFPLYHYHVESHGRIFP